MRKTKTRKTGDKIAELIVQPYGFKLSLIVTDDIPGAMRRFPLLSDVKTEKCEGLFISKDFDFFIFLSRPLITHLHIAHEVFHCTMRMMDTADDYFDLEHQESYAYLCGYLHDRIYNLITRVWHLKVR